MLGFGLAGRKISIKGITYFGHYSIYSQYWFINIHKGLLMDSPKRVLGIKEVPYASR
jgi:hypothetical protein